MNDNCETIEDNEDSYSKITTDILFLQDKLRILREKIKKNPWYRIVTYIKLFKELRELERETTEIEERLLKIHVSNKNPIKIVKRC